MRLESRNKAVPLLQASRLVADEELCLNLRGRIEFCADCKDSCESDALELTADRVDILSENCTACGACIPACPAGVLHLSGFSPARFLDAVQDREEIHLHCSESSDGGGGVVVPCHKVLDERLLASAMAEGCQVFLFHGLDHCMQCEKGDASIHLEEVEERLQEWFGDRAPRILCTNDNEVNTTDPLRREDQERISRRNFLRLLGARAGEAAAEWVIPSTGEEEEDILPFYQSEGTYQRPVPYQQLLAARVQKLPWQTGAPLPWYGRTLAEHCTACMVCGERCPTGALQSMQSTPQRKISFEAALCTGCSLCERLCPVDAVRAVQAHSIEEVTQPRVLLMARVLKQCVQCGDAFVPVSEDADRCPVCRNEQDLDDEWLEMLQG